MNRDLRESDNDYSENRDVVKDKEFASNRINLFGLKNDGDDENEK